MLAVMSGVAESAEILLRAGADLDARNAVGVTSMQAVQGRRDCDYCSVMVKSMESAGFAAKPRASIDPPLRR